MVLVRQTTPRSVPDRHPSCALQAEHTPPYRLLAGHGGQEVTQQPSLCPWSLRTNVATTRCPEQPLCSCALGLAGREGCRAQRASVGEGWCCRVVSAPCRIPARTGDGIRAASSTRPSPGRALKCRQHSPLAVVRQHRLSCARFVLRSYRRVRGFRLQHSRAPGRRRCWGSLCSAGFCSAGGATGLALPNSSRCFWLQVFGRRDFAGSHSHCYNP